MSAPDLRPFADDPDPTPAPELNTELAPKLGAELAPELKPDLAPELPPTTGPGTEEYEPTTVALVFMLPPLALGAALAAVLFRHQLTLDALGAALLVGTLISIVVFAFVRRLFR